MLAVTDLSGSGCLSTSFYYYFDICSSSVVLTPPGGALAAGTVGVPYSAALSASGGSNGYYWQDQGGVPGISLSASGLTTNAAGNTLAGTPTAAGTFTATLKLSDWPNWTSSNPVASQCPTTTYQFTITVAGVDSGAPDASMEDAPAEAPACMLLGSSCATDGQCCGGLACGLLEMSCCVPAQGHCQQSSDCCTTLSGGQDNVCNGGICEPPEAAADAAPDAVACLPVGGLCGTQGECCSGLQCDPVEMSCCVQAQGRARAAATAAPSRRLRRAWRAPTRSVSRPPSAWRSASRAAATRIAASRISVAPPRRARARRRACAASRLPTTRRRLGPRSGSSGSR